MKTGKCPKCASKDVYFKQFEVAGLAGILGGKAGAVREKVEYVCTNCGYREEYVLDPQALQKVAKEWKRSA
jgi:predicted nucleic-acid-binding Zn-ribbon protein